MTTATAANDQSVELTESQRKVTEMDLGVIGTWWKIMSKPRSFFVRAGVHAGNYGDELLFASGQGPDPLFFLLNLFLVSVLVMALSSGSLLAGTGVLLQSLFGIVSMALQFVAAAFTCYLLAKITRCPGNFESAKSLVAFSAAPQVIVALGTLALGLPALIAIGYSGVLMYFGIRHIYRASIVKALFMWLVLVSVMIVASIAAKQI